MSHLISRTILGFITLMVSLALALFIPAGSSSFWRAWVYLAVFSGCVILITAYLAKYDQKPWGYPHSRARPSFPDNVGLPEN